MDHLLKFLEELSKTGTYYAETVENCAEIYIEGDETPAVLLELKGSYYHVNFRCDIPSRQVAQLMYDMTVIDEDIIVEAEFIISQEEGIIYGQNALALFYMTVQKAMDDAQLKHEMGPDNVLFVVEQPIHAYGNRNERNQNKLHQLWGLDL